MKAYLHLGNIKAGLFLLAILLVTALLLFSQKIVHDLRQDHREIVRLYSELIASASQESDENLDFIFEKVIKNIQFPVIQSDADNIPQFYRNLKRNDYSEAELLRIMQSMDRQNQPIPLVYKDQDTEFVFGYLHFSDSRSIQKLKWLPYIEIGAVALFVLVGFIGFTIIRNSEKHHIWIGMARETAHQLGTPVSALMGWVHLLKDRSTDVTEVVGEMETDLNRLAQVSERFSKMGTESDLEPVDLKELTGSMVSYLEKRLPSLGKQVVIDTVGVQPVSIRANHVLLSWAIENIVRNGIDAVDESHGLIRLHTRTDDKGVYLIITDNGIGIERRHWKNVFRPGYSTKKRGWGMGLSLTLRIIREIHGGDIAIVSSSPEAGTVFEITLPLEQR
ncbi:MAG: ATP-binding protein [Fidelibacterota bacterium]